MPELETVEVKEDPAVLVESPQKTDPAPTPEPVELEEVDDDEEEDDDEEAVDHPYDRLMTCVEVIDGQMNRLKKKQTHDLRAELTLNIYPILKNSLLTIAEYLDMLEEGEGGEEEEEGPDAEQIKEFQRMAEEEGKKILNACDLILEMDKILDTKTRSKLPEQYDKILAWAREKKVQASGQATEPVPAP